MRTNWEKWPIDEQDIQEWKLFVACYEELGARSPAVWIQAWTRTTPIYDIPDTARRAVNIYIRRSDVRVLIVETVMCRPKHD